MKTNRMIIIVNEMIEDESPLQANLSWHGIHRAYQDSEDYSLAWEDIFIGSSASWAGIKDRIADYALLSHLRSGKLEVLYHSLFDKSVAFFNSNYQDFLQFFDESLCVKEFEKLNYEFHPAFQLELKRLEDLSLIFPERKEMVLRTQDAKKLRVGEMILSHSEQDWMQSYNYKFA